MEKKRIIISLLVLSLCFPILTFAGTIILKSGQKIEGKITERTDKYINVDIAGVAVPYFMDDIESIDGEKSVSHSMKEEMPAQKELITVKQSQNYDVTDHQDIFEKRLSDLITIIKSGSSKENFQLVGTKFSQFAQDYPNSKFAKDSKYISTIIGFMAEVVKGDKELAEKLLKDMEAIVKQYPDGSLEELTCNKWEEVSDIDGGDLTAAYIPFKYILQFMRGTIAFDLNKDYEEAIKEFSFLKDNLDFSVDKTGNLASGIYLPLVISYKSTNNFDKFNEIVQEAAEKFADTKLGQNMQKILDKKKQ